MCLCAAGDSIVAVLSHETQSLSLTPSAVPTVLMYLT